MGRWIYSCKMFNVENAGEWIICDGCNYTTVIAINCEYQVWFTGIYGSHVACWAFPGVFLKPGNRQCLGYKWLADVLVFSVILTTLSLKSWRMQGKVFYKTMNWIEHFKVLFLCTSWVIFSGNIILIKFWYLSNINEKLFLYIYINQPLNKIHCNWYL